MRRTLPKPGFTLVELLVALGLTIFLLALFTTLMVAATGSINTSQGIGAADQQVRNAIMSLRDDLNNVYVANNGTRLALSKLFTSADRIPSQGYFMLEENDRAIRQGMDPSGLPVEIDTDDVLAFTVGRPAAASAEEYYYGRVYNNPAIQNPPATPNVINDFGEYLDNTFNSPTIRFDARDNSQFSSRFAEVVYFLRPSGGRNYSVNDLRGDISTSPPTMPPLPATYTLYRRQLLVVENADKLNRDPINPTALFPDGINLAVIPGAPTSRPWTVYDLYDLSVSREFEVVNIPTPATVNWTFNGAARLHLNTLEDLSRREYRFGMRLFQFPFPTSGTPTAMLVRAAPISQFPANTPPIVHNYRDEDPANNPVPSDANVVRWFGRPTQEETSNAQYPFWPQPSASAAIDTMLADTDGNASFDLDPAQRGERAGDDVLLTNVVSFDIKVFDEVECPPTVRSRAYQAQVSPGVNPLDDLLVKSRGANTNMIYLDPTDPNLLTTTEAPQHSSFRRPGFVDLGFAFDRSNALDPTSPIPGDNASVRLDSSYFYHPTLARFGVPFNPGDLLMNLANTSTGSFAAGPNLAFGDADDFQTVYASYPSADPLATRWPRVRGYFLGGPLTSLPGRNGIDDDGNGTDDDAPEYLWPGSDDCSAFIEAPFGSSGQVGTATGDPIAATNPRSTYDTWSDHPSYHPNPKLELPADPKEPNPNFRPVPYPRPLRGIQIKLRVLEPKSGIVREFTLRHFFDEK